MITFQTNPKLPDFMYLLTDGDGLKLVVSALAIINDEKTVVFPNDTGTLVSGWKIVDTKEFDTKYTSSAAKQRFRDRIGLFSCAFILLLGITLGVTLGTIVVGLISKAFS